MNSDVKRVLDIFRDINRVPRKSKHEEKISEWLVKWAEDHGLESKRDELLNVLIKVPASKGMENKPVIVIQGHMDMVCEKTPDSQHDFSKDAIKNIIEGDWLKADKTTLGADNGIALAMALAIAENDKIKHPALELLFTVDEETGLTGASGLESDFISGKVLLNLDSEDEGVFTVGCAGGRDTHINLPLKNISVSEGYSFVKISVGGLKGGHSGVEINQLRGNANKILARVLHYLNKDINFGISELKGGSAHNAIPRDAYAVIALPCCNASIIDTAINGYHEILKKEYEKVEPMLILKSELVEKHEKMSDAESTSKIVALMLAMPHGVAAMSADVPGLVETSNNFATAEVKDDNFAVMSSQRSSVMSRLDTITSKVESVGYLAGAEVKSGNGYPSWEPNMDSELLKKCVSVYEDIFDREPVVEIIHAGLECGIIGSKIEGMDMISYGPTIKNPHSPDEKMSISSLEKVWDFTVELLKSF